MISMRVHPYGGHCITTFTFGLYTISLIPENVSVFDESDPGKPAVEIIQSPTTEQLYQLMTKYRELKQV